MPVCDELNIPIVVRARSQSLLVNLQNTHHSTYRQVDYHHDWINPSSRRLSDLIPIINETWKRKGIPPKQHLSEPRPGAVTVMERRAHADRCQTLPDALPDDMDLMIEVRLDLSSAVICEAEGVDSVLG